MTDCLLPWCFRIEFQRVRCRVVIRAGAPVNPPVAKDFEDDIKSKYVDFTFGCLGDGCVCTLGNPSAWQQMGTALQGVPYTLGGAQYTIDYSLRFDVRIKWGTCGHPKKAAGGGKKKAAKKKRRR